MNPKSFAPALLLSLLFLSCNRNQKEKLEIQDGVMSKVEREESSPQDAKQEKQKIPIGDPKTNLQNSGINSSPLQPAAHVDWDKKIIKTATVKLEIKDFKKYNDNIHAVIKKFGGYIAQEEQHLTDEKSETILSIKVPIDQFETMMNELPVSDAKIMERNISSQDVSGEVIDTRSRLEAKKQVRLKYLDFLKASKNMDEVLKVQSEINGIQEEIEAAAGRVEYLSHQSAFSTINLTFYQPVVGFKPVVDVTPSFFTRISDAFKLGVGWISDLFVAMVSIWPLLLIAIGAFFAFKRRKFFKIHPQNP